MKYELQDFVEFCALILASVTGPAQYKDGWQNLC